MSIQVNLFGLVPNGRQPGSWRMIVNHSFPDGRSAYDGIDAELCSLRYISIGTACLKMLFLGQEAMLGAFWTLPVHPSNCWLQGMKWEGCIYVDEDHPFGLPSAPKLYNAIADGLLWVLWSWDKVEGIHYLDDFLLFGLPEYWQCAESLSGALANCDLMGLPMVPAMTESPSTKLVFLGIELGSASLTWSVPQPKLNYL